MEFNEKIKQFAERIRSVKDSIQTEEATKTSLIMPFFSTLGYDVFNPEEFMPEFTADVGIKKGEKVDYAIMIDKEPTILVEAKWIGEKLDNHASQLFRYFNTVNAKFAILTNGVVYKFFTDLEEKNKMDTTPFLEINLEDISDNEIQELKKFSKEQFDLNEILDTASELKYLGLIKKVLKEEFAKPSDDFIRYILSQNIYDGRCTQNIIDKYRPIVKKSISQYINDLVNDKIQNALKTEEDKTLEQEIIEVVEEDENTPDSIVTTEEEIQAFYIVRSILGAVAPVSRFTYKDTINYFAVTIDGKVTKWVCRLSLKDSSKYIIIPKDKENIKYSLESIDDLYKLSGALIERLKNIL